MWIIFYFGVSLLTSDNTSFHGYDLICFVFVYIFLSATSWVHSSRSCTFFLAIFSVPCHLMLSSYLDEIRYNCISVNVFNDCWVCFREPNNYATFWSCSFPAAFPFVPWIISCSSTILSKISLCIAYLLVGLLLVTTQILDKRISYLF